MAFQFPPVIRAQGSIWHLIYAPDSPNTLMPSLQEGKLQNVFGQWISIPDGVGGVNKYFMSVVDLVFPAVNTPIYRKPSQYVRAFSLSPREVDPTTQPPQSMAMYTREVEPPVNVAQEFMNAILGQTQAMQQQTQAQDDWVRLLPSDKQKEGPKVPQPTVEVTDGSSPA